MLIQGAGFPARLHNASYQKQGSPCRGSHGMRKLKTLAACFYYPPEAWPDTVSRFGSRFRLAAGMAASLRSFADHLGRRWLQGVAAARAAFASAPPQMA
jgi:hypothetical protein